MIRAVGSVTRIVNLSFKISGVKEETNTIRDLTKAVYHAISIIKIARLAYKAFLAELGPAGWLLLGASVLGEVVIIKQEFTAKEEVGARGR